MIKKVILNNTKNTSHLAFVIIFDDEVYEPKLVSYTGEDAAQIFVESLEENVREIASIPEKKMIFGKEEKTYFTTKLNVRYVVKNSLTMIRLEIIVILPVGIQVPHTTRVIVSIENLILRLWCSITLVGIIATYL